MKNLTTQMIYRIVLCCISALGVLLTFNIFYVGQGPHNLSWEFLKYYTNISNYFVFAVSVVILVDNIKRVRAGEKEGYNEKIHNLKFIVTVMILVTFLVYIILLGDPFSADFWRSLGNLSYHVFAPILFILDFFLFEKKKSVSVFAPLLSTIIPLIYVVYIMILGVAIPGFEYPYFFLNVNKLGYGGVVVWVVILCAVFIALGYILWFYNRLVKENGKWKFDLKNILWLRSPKELGANETRKKYVDQKAKYAYGLYKKGLPFKKVYAAVEKDGKFLVLKQAEGRKYKYSLSGGGVDEGEDNITAIKREILEEMNINIEVVKSLGIKRYTRTWHYKDKTFDIEYEAEIFYTKYVSDGVNKDFGLAGEFNASNVTGIVSISKEEMINSVYEFIDGEIKLD